MRTVLGASRIQAGVQPRKRKPGPSALSDCVRTVIGPCRFRGETELKRGQVLCKESSSKRDTHMAGAGRVHDPRSNNVSRAADGCRRVRRRAAQSVQIR